MNKKIFISILMIFTFLISACGKEETSPPVSETETETKQVEKIEKSEKNSESEEKKLQSSENAEKLFVGIEEKISKNLNDGTEYAVFLAYPKKSSTPFIHNSKKMRSASLIKVFILAAAMEKVKVGELDLNENLTLQASDKVGGAGILAGYASGSKISVEELLRLMITESDNTATNIIIDKIGMENINRYIQSQNYSDTILQRKMMDFNGKENYSSVADLGNIFTKIYNRKCVDKKLDEIMIDFLKGQTDKDCFPSALPNKIIAHKTGALAGLYDDGGIIFDGDNDAVLVIMTENFVSEQSAIQHMISFTRSIFDK